MTSARIRCFHSAAIPDPPATAERDIEVWTKDTRWQVAASLADSLLDENGIRLEEWKQLGLATLVKQGAGRTIHRVRLPEAEVYVKHFRPTNPFSLLHQFVREDRAQKEYRVARHLRELGVATIRPVALGERRLGSLRLESWLVTEAIADGITLFDLIERFLLTGRMPLPASLRLHLTQELASLTADIHEAGVEHRDLHERNIVVQPRPGGRFDFFMLDLHEMRLKRPLSWKDACRDLARMGRYFTLRTTASDRRRFFRAYARARGFSERQSRDLSRAVEAATVASRADFWRRRDARNTARNVKFTDLRVPGARVVAAPEFPEELLLSLMKNPDRPFRESVARWWKDGRSTRVAEVNLPSLRTRDNLVYKKYHFKGWHESLATIIRPNQARRAWSNAAALQLRELPTPRPLALIETTRLGLPVNSFLLMERVPGLALHEYLNDRASAAEGAERRRIIRGVAETAARLLRKLHDRRVTHRDLKASNVLATPTDDHAAPRLWLIDLDGVQTWHHVPDCHRMQNLARFHVNFRRCPFVTRTEKLRFLRVYLGRRFADRKEWKRVWRAVERGTDEKIRRNLRRGRALL